MDAEVEYMVFKKISFNITGHELGSYYAAYNGTGCFLFEQNHTETVMEKYVAKQRVIDSFESWYVWKTMAISTV